MTCWSNPFVPQQWHAEAAASHSVTCDTAGSSSPDQHVSSNNYYTHKNTTVIQLTTSLVCTVRRPLSTTKPAQFWLRFVWLNTNNYFLPGWWLTQHKFTSINTFTTHDCTNTWDQVLNLENVNCSRNAVCLLDYYSFILTVDYCGTRSCHMRRWGHQQLRIHQWKTRPSSWANPKTHFRLKHQFSVKEVLRSVFTFSCDVKKQFMNNFKVTQDI